MVYCFDIDGVICTDYPTNDYTGKLPYMSTILRINKLYEDGHTIKLLTARGSASGIDWREHTINQLDGWGLKYHELHLGKVHADIYIDDKGMSFAEWALNG